MILTKENTPAPDALGAANGIGEFMQMIGISIGSTFIRSATCFCTILLRDALKSADVILALCMRFQFPWTV